jgi:GxxExxY protein
MDNQNKDRIRTEPDEKLDRVARATVDAAIEVHRHLGPGYLESVYEEALSVELGLRDLPFVRQIPTLVQNKS